MRVLVVSKFLHYVGGVETYVRYLAHSLADSGVEVGLLGMTPPEGAALMDLPAGPRWFTANRSYAQGAAHRASSAAQSIWAPQAGRTMRRALAQFEPDVVHFHGTCYQLTPAVVKPVADAGIPAVLTAHEYKLICINQTLFDDAASSICTACVGCSSLGKITNPLQRSCLKGSLPVSAIGALESRVAEPVWRRADPRILAPSQFMRDRLVEDGWSADRVEYLDLPWRPAARNVAPPDDARPRHTLVFLGRLATIKGADRVIRAWSYLHETHPDVRLRILGDGEQRAALEAEVLARGLPRVDFLGHCEREQIDEELATALVTAHPSQCHENSPYSVRESLMAGVPAIVSRVGGMPEMVDRHTGWVVPHDDDVAWRETLAQALRAGLAQSDDLRASVLNRAVTEEDHLHRLRTVYDEERGRVRTIAPLRRRKGARA